jgi:hypothetical protein
MNIAVMGIPNRDDKTACCARGQILLAQDWTIGNKDVPNKATLLRFDS